MDNRMYHFIIINRGLHVYQKQGTQKVNYILWVLLHFSGPQGLWIVCCSHSKLEFRYCARGRQCCSAAIDTPFSVSLKSIYRKKNIDEISIYRHIDEKQLPIIFFLLKQLRLHITINMYIYAYVSSCLYFLFTSIQLKA